MNGKPSGPCHPRIGCVELSDDLYCLWPELTVAECESAGGAPTQSYGYDVLETYGCASGLGLGTLSDGDGEFCAEGCLCCQQADPCPPQWAHVTGDCEGDDSIYGSDRFFWDGVRCVARNGCECTGVDCWNWYPSLRACEEATRACDATPCGGRNPPCEAGSYCAYQSECGQLDGSSVCRPRPTSCSQITDPVCGCDQQDYTSPCEAARAGVGVLTWGACG